MTAAPFIMRRRRVGAIRVLEALLERTDGAAGHAAVYGVRGSFYAELFGARVRYSGASISAYVVALCALSVACYALAEETLRKDTDANEEHRIVAERKGKV